MKFESSQQFLNRTTTESGTRPYDVYSAVLTQTGINNIVPIELENTIGNITWSRSGTGSYLATLPVTTNPQKIFPIIQDTHDYSVNAWVYMATFTENSSSVRVHVYDPLNGSFAELSTVSTINRTPFEIRIYS